MRYIPNSWYWYSLEGKIAKGTEERKWGDFKFFHVWFL